MMKTKHTVINTQEICYVCNEIIGKRKARYIGQGKYRHESCEMGSNKWMNSKVSKNSKFKKYI